MATLTYIRETKQSISAMKDVIDYCCQQKKVYDSDTNRRLISGINCDGENAFTEFMTTKEALKTRIGRMIIAIISGAISSVISTLLCIHFPG